MKATLLTVIFQFSAAAFLFGQSVSSTTHNLSTSGSGIIADTESEICIFCHTPHNSVPTGPLWNRNDPGATYTLYDNTVSSTIQAIPGQPDGSSILCLSCHDGTIALGSVVSRTNDISFVSGTIVMPAGNTNLTTDLSDDHPVSFVYNSALAAGDGNLKFPPSYPVSTDENSKLQCTSCHDPHKNSYTKFLVTTKEASAVCLSCHSIAIWPGSSHENSLAVWNSSGTNPWAHIDSPFATVAQNGCENCHSPHSALGNERLLKSNLEENNCLDCHNANVASTNIETQLTKTYRHNVYAYTDIHDATENPLVGTTHVECVDCHNPHSASNSSASAPYPNGFISNVPGISQAGTAVSEISYAYELCYRCHADNAISSSVISRQIVQNNTRLEFDPGNPSFHPVAGQGVNSDVPSLIAPYTETSMIYCTDCHASDGTGSPNGPHGSIYPQILKYRYETADNTVESALTYELCYSCHSRTSIRNDESFIHLVHLEDDTPCSACHDPHGISADQGSNINNSNLINFDTDIVSPRNGNLYFEDTGLHHGFCFLTCHGKNHGFGLSY
jgi:predicted CXXCH cytochrome family protein